VSPTHLEESGTISALDSASEVLHPWDKHELENKSEDPPFQPRFYDFIQAHRY
jgi:hypothetical protein